MTEGPPPVPGGRTPEEREAARRERAARRAARGGGHGAAAEPLRPPAVDRAAAARGPSRRLRQRGPAPRRIGPPARPAAAGPDRRARRWGRMRRPLLAGRPGGLGAAAWFAALAVPAPPRRRREPARRADDPAGGQPWARSPTCSSRTGWSGARASSSCGPAWPAAASELQAGPLQLRQDLSYMAALDALERGVPPNVVQVTVPEGRSRREIAPLVRRLPGNYVRATRRSPLLSPRRYGAPGAREPRGLPLPGDLRAEEGPAGAAPGRPAADGVQAQVRRGGPQLRPAPEPDRPTTCSRSPRSSSARRRWPGSGRSSLR